MAWQTIIKIPFSYGAIKVVKNFIVDDDFINIHVNFF